MQKNLTIEDRIYGSFTIEEPVLLELIESPALQRLKGIFQFGMPQRFYHYSGFLRYEHSIGGYGASKKTWSKFRRTSFRINS